MKLIQQGRRDAKIVAVGESPGTTEMATGIPFTGGSGHLLDGMLNSAGISRGDVFVTNLAHVQPPKNEFSWFLKKENTPHLLIGMAVLKRDLEEIKPNLVLALGAQPLRVLTGKVGIDKWRGSILPCTLVPGLKVLATYHPAYILRVMDYRAVAEFDLKRAATEREFPDIRYPARTIFTPEGVHCRRGTEWEFSPGAIPIDEMAHEMMRAEFLAVDIECWEDDQGQWKLSCVGFSDRSARALVLPWSGEHNKHLIRLLCESPAAKVLQNGTFDSTVMMQNGIEIKNFVWDTMLAHHALYAESASGSDEMSNLSGKKRQSAIAKGLAFQTSLYTNEPFYKDDGKVWKQSGDVQVFYRYNGLDNAVTREIRDVQHRELDSYGTWDTFKHSMSLVQPLMAATNRGIKVDLAERERLRVECQQKVAHWQAVLDGSAEGSVNVKSSKQVKELLYGKLGFAAKRQRGTGKISADKDAIAALAGRYEHPSLKAIIQIREQRDLLERYLNARLDADGRMRCSFDITGTRSGRLSSRMSIYGSGTNLQTIPPDLRRMFVADEGKVFVYRDYSQAEARVVAYLARCPKLIEVFEDPTRSIHKENASRIFNIPVEKISKKSSEYFLGKVVGHSTNYGGTEASTMETVNAAADETGIRVTLQQMRIIKERYLAIYPEIVENFWADVERQLAKDRTLTSPFGRKRTYYGRYDDKLRRDAYSWIPQSTVGDLGTRAIVRVCREIPEAEFLLNVHDSLLVQCDVDKAIRVAKAMEHSMDIPITIHGVEVHIPSDCKIGKNWSDADETNPNGLVELDQWEARYGGD